jgi:hypothetical protein
VKQNIDWESKYNTAAKKAMGDNTSIIDVVTQTAATVTKEQQQKNDKFLESAICEEFTPMVFSSI